MRTAMAIGTLLLMLALSGSMALAAPPTPPGKEHGQGQGQGQGLVQVQEQEQEEEEDQERGRGQGQGEVQGQDQDQNSGQGQGETHGQGKNNADSSGFAKRHGAAGVVQSKDSNSFDLLTKQGTVHVLVNGNTRFLIKDVASPDLGDVSNNDRVNVNGTRDDSGNLVARFVHVIPGKPATSHSVGLVSSSSGGSITIKNRKSGEEQTFTVTSDTTIKLPNGRSDISNDDLVTVVGSNGTARAIVVHGADGDQDKDKDRDTDEEQD